MDMKCSLHVGGKWSLKHNLRDYDPDKWNKDGHIDEERKELNNVLTYTEYRKFIDETFGDALMAFNESQRKKHPERLIGFDSGKAYDRTSPKKRRSKAVSAYARKHRENVQEIIIQLGDHGEYKAMAAEHGQERADKLYHDYLKECYDKWLKDNSTFKPFCAVIHMDEVRDGTPHLHLTYLATASSSRGLRTKVSIEGALAALDYERKKDQLYEESPYRRWLKDTRKAYEDFAQEYVDRHDLGIKILPSEKSVTHHQEPPAYKEKKAVKAAQEELQQLQQDNSALDSANTDLINTNFDLTVENEQLTADNKGLTEQKEQLTVDVEQLTAKKSEGLKAVVGAFKAKKTRRAAQKVIDNAEDITKALTEDAERHRQAAVSAKEQAEEHARHMRLAKEQVEEERALVAEERAAVSARNEQLDREVDKQVDKRTAEYKKALDEEKKDHQRDNKVANKIIEELEEENLNLRKDLGFEEEEEEVLDLTGGRDYDRGR